MACTSRFLYRYYSNPEYIIDVLANRRLYHCKPDEFNDPLDCRPMLSLWHSRSESESVWRKFFYYLAPPDSSEPDREKYAEDFIAQGVHRDPKWLRNADEILKDQDPIRVCCFAKSPRNTMLWAHYANDYKGVVFQFRAALLRSGDPLVFRGQEVRYSAYPWTISDCLPMLESASVHRDPLPLGRLVYCMKSDYWSKENEVRFFTYPDQQYVEFDEPALSGIIIGEKAGKGLIQTLIWGIKEWRTPPRLFKTAIDKTTFRLWINRYGSH